MNKKVEALSEDDGDEKEQYVAVEDNEEQQQDTREQSHDDDDDQEDSRLDADSGEREEIRRRRREEKAERAQRRKAAIERDKAELTLLRQQNEELMRRVQNVEKFTHSTNVATVNARIQDAVEEARAAEHIIAQAVEAGNGADVAKAMRIRDEALQKANQLHAYKKQVEAKAIQPKPADPRLNPVPPENNLATKLAADWVKMNSWYDPQAGDERSKKVLEIDQTLANEGYNPNSLEYWRELDRRVESSGVARRKSANGGPPVGGSRNDSSRAGRNEVYISPERKQAMIDAGVWEDPAARQRYLKAYAKWDRDNNSAR
jgi:hypothetical protein